MATLVLGTVGRVFGGPIGGIIGTVVGGIVDRGNFGGGGGGASRVANLAVQSAAYGEPIPIIAGRMRAAGNLIWTSGIKESPGPGGGKGSSAAAGYSYSASFAVGLAARPIVEVGRIWADGRLIRSADGAFLAPVSMRLHLGSEDQAGDSLIIAAEGADGAPAYRGLAYAVFENLPLADYGNRIPNLTFEIIADSGATIDAGAVMQALAAGQGQPQLAMSGSFPAIEGHVAGRSGSIAEAMAPLFALSGAALEDDGRLVLRGDGGAPTVIGVNDRQAYRPGDSRPADRQQLLGGEALVGVVELAFYDTSRDYQPGLQRARRGGIGIVDQQAVPCALAPAAAKLLATALLGRAGAARMRANVRLPWAWLGTRPGDRVVLGDATSVQWRVREARFEGFVVGLDLERVETAAPAAAVADGGRALAFDDQPAGPTSLAVLDVPALPGDLPFGPRLWIAASGGGAGWRRALIEVSGDDGASYAPLGMVAGGAVQGVAVGQLGAGNVDGWDRFAAIEVELLSDAMWLEGRTEAAVLAGSNLALIGDEILHFAVAEALAPRRFRLSGLLRGRRGTEAAVAGHVVGERFVLLDPAALLAFDPPIEAIGRAYRFRAQGAGDSDSPYVTAVAGGAALRPLAPVALRLVEAGGMITASWIRRSRAGFGWPDFVDAPLGEASEAYRVDVLIDGQPARTATVTEARFTYSDADRMADGDGNVVAMHVAQLSGTVGPGATAIAILVRQ
jgi:hypothetical protein